MIVDLVFNFLSIHFGKSKVSQNGSQLNSGNRIVTSGVELECVFDLVLHIFWEFAIYVLSFTFDVCVVFLWGLHFAMNFYELISFLIFFILKGKLYYFYFEAIRL